MQRPASVADARAVRPLRETQATLPFIIISGTVGEEEAVKSLQVGATDYLLKQRLGISLPDSLEELQDDEPFRAAANDHQKIVEVMRDAAGELAQ